MHILFKGGKNFYYKNEVNDDENKNSNNNRINNSKKISNKSFEFKTKPIGSTPNNNDMTHDESLWSS